MNRASASLITEEWLDADFDLTDDDEPLRALDPGSDKDDVEDWDIEMDLGSTGGAKVMPAPLKFVVHSERVSSPHQPITIRPPLQPTLDEEEEEEEGVSTIKMGTLRPKVDPP